MCVGGVRRILLLSLVTRDNRCIYMAHACFNVRFSDCVVFCGNVCCVAGVVKNSVLTLEW